MKRTPMLKTSEESAWLFHEIGRAYWELNSYNEAKEYGVKSLDAGRDCGDQVWQLNAFMLIAQAEGSECDSKCFESCFSLCLSLPPAKSGDLSNAVASFKESLELATIVGDTESEEGIKKALEQVNKQIVDNLQQPQDDNNHQEITA